MTKKPKRFRETILFLAQKLRDCQYAFRGTAGLVLQGIEMKVDDIDVLCDEETALKCNSLLKDFSIDEVGYKESDKFKSFFGKFEVKGIHVEVMGDWQIKDTKGVWGQLFDAGDSQRKRILFAGEKIWVTKTETELAMFAQMGRWTAYQKIKKQLKAPKEDYQQKLF